MLLSGFVIYVMLTSSAYCILVSFSFSSSAENDTAVLSSFRFRTENKLPFTAFVSFSAKNAKPGFGWSLSYDILCTRVLGT